MAAGNLRVRVCFERQGVGASNGMGSRPAAWNRVGPEETFVDVKAAAGAEVVIAGRLAGREPAEIELRSSPFTRTLTSRDRMRELDAPARVWNIRSTRAHDRRRGYLILTAETGGAGS